MNRIIEVNFLPAPVEEIKKKPRILIIDNSRDFTHSAKLALERTGRYSVWEENEPARAHQTAQRVKADLILLDIARMSSVNPATLTMYLLGFLFLELVHLIP